MNGEQMGIHQLLDKGCHDYQINLLIRSSKYFVFSHWACHTYRKDTNGPRECKDILMKNNTEGLPWWHSG